MTYGSSEHEFAAGPPPDALSALDAAARALEELERRGAQLALSAADDGSAVRVHLVEGETLRTLRPTELFDLLA